MPKNTQVEKADGTERRESCELTDTEAQQAQGGLDLIGRLDGFPGGSKGLQPTNGGDPFELPEGLFEPAQHQPGAHAGGGGIYLEKGNMLVKP